VKISKVKRKKFYAVNFLPIVNDSFFIEKGAKPKTTENSQRQIALSQS
jgi:hypothetical protein